MVAKTIVAKKRVAKKRVAKKRVAGKMVERKVGDPSHCCRTKPKPHLRGWEINVDLLPESIFYYQGKGTLL